MEVQKISLRMTDHNTASLKQKLAATSTRLTSLQAAPVLGAADKYVLAWQILPHVA